MKGEYSNKVSRMDTILATEAYLWVEKVCVNYSTLYVIEVSIVLQSPLQQSGFLTQLGNVGTVVVGKHLVAQDSICNLQ